MNQKDKHGNPVMHHIVRSCHVKPLKLLIESGADVKQIDWLGRPALAHAVKPVHTHICASRLMRIFFRSGARINTPWIRITRESFHSYNTHYIGCTFEGRLYKIFPACRRNNSIYEVGMDYSRYSRSHEDQRKIRELLSAAGEEDDYLNLHSHLSPPSEINLMNICSRVIRQHLLLMDNVNLLYRVPRLGFPTALENYLLYDIPQEDDQDDDDGDEHMILSHLYGLVPFLPTDF